MKTRHYKIEIFDEDEDKTNSLRHYYVLFSVTSKDKPSTSWIIGEAHNQLVISDKQRQNTIGIKEISKFKFERILNGTSK